MERLNFVKNGVSRLPPGFRFQPTDEELVFQYLKCKIFSSQLPASIIPEINNVSKYDPWDLPGNCDDEERYFFSSKEVKYRRGNRMNRTSNSGYWKATGSDKKISSSINNGIVGLRKTLVFYEGKSPNGSRTEWVMHEYRLVSVETSASNSSQKDANEIGDWVLCRISLKKRSIESDNNTTPSGRTMVNNAEMAQPRFFDFLSVHHNSLPAPAHSSTSSTCSSSNNVVDVSFPNHEETSGYGHF
ncbi:unnamed protein product [Sphenostylis stenocarpa]|uniref:NAC domain-containing protein n=1 Tax=Sphenostylis stenocarpa TaxID=92480 RepID=A0AA86TPX8_9FABA|nr:unnamed protein product [Sphenostylis stenocarpa]